MTSDFTLVVHLKFSLSLCILLLFPFAYTYFERYYTNKSRRNNNERKKGNFTRKSLRYTKTRSFVCIEGKYSWRFIRDERFSGFILNCSIPLKMFFFSLLGCLNLFLL